MQKMGGGGGGGGEVYLIVYLNKGVDINGGMPKKWRAYLSKSSKCHVYLYQWFSLEASLSNHQNACC